MSSQLIQQAIRDPTSSSSSEVMSDITPDILKGTMPSILDKVYEGEDSSVLAENALDTIIDTVEVAVLDDAFDIVYDKFADRIYDMIINGAFVQIFEKVSSLFPV